MQWENWELMNLTKELEIGCTNLLLFILCNIKIITLVHYIGFPIEFKHFVALSRRVKLKQPIQLENLVYPHLSLTKRYIPLLKLFFQISHNQRYVCTFKTVDISNNFINPREKFLKWKGKRNVSRNNVTASLWKKEANCVATCLKTS